MEAAEPHVDGVDGAAAELFDDRVARLLDAQPALHVRTLGAGEFDGAVDAEEVRGVQQVDVQDLALDPLAAVQQPPQRGDLPGHRDAAGVLEGPAGAHLVRDRADAAHPGGDVGRLGVRAAAQERLEEPRRLVDAQLGSGDRAVIDRQVQRSLPLDPGERADMQHPRTTVGHDGAPSTSAKDAALYVRRARRTSSSLMPSRRSNGISAGRLTEPDGPKQP